MSDNEKVILTIQITKDMKDFLQAEAKKNERSLTQHIRYLLGKNILAGLVNSEQSAN